MLILIHTKKLCVCGADLLYKTTVKRQSASMSHFWREAYNSDPNLDIQLESATRDLVIVGSVLPFDVVLSVVSCQLQSRINSCA